MYHIDCQLYILFEYHFTWAISTHNYGIIIKFEDSMSKTRILECSNIFSSFLHKAWQLKNDIHMVLQKSNSFFE
jgi:hypothetical protein